MTGLGLDVKVDTPSDYAKSYARRKGRGHEMNAGCLLKAVVKTTALI